MFKVFKEAWKENKIGFIIDVSAALLMGIGGYVLLYLAFAINHI